MTGARQVLIERDDLEELLQIVREATTFYDDGTGVDGLPITTRRRLDEGEERMVERVQREVLGR